MSEKEIRAEKVGMIAYVRTTNEFSTKARLTKRTQRQNIEQMTRGMRAEASRLV